MLAHWGLWSAQSYGFVFMEWPVVSPGRVAFSLLPSLSLQLQWCSSGFPTLTRDPGFSISVNLHASKLLIFTLQWITHLVLNGPAAPSLARMLSAFNCENRHPCHLFAPPLHQQSDAWFLCGVCMLSMCLCGFSPVFSLKTHTPGWLAEIALIQVCVTGCCVHPD